MPKFLVQKPLSQIEEERQEAAVDRNIDLYEAIAGLSEDLATAQQTIIDLTARIEKLEGGV